MTHTYVGGIVGSFYQNEPKGIIESCISMANVTASISKTYLYIGGIVGSVSSSSALSGYVALKNCASYGQVLVTKSDITDIYIGGVAGENEAIAFNCLSYGPITVTNSSSTYLYVGGMLVLMVVQLKIA